MGSPYFGFCDVYLEDLREEKKSPPPPPIIPISPSLRHPPSIASKLISYFFLKQQKPPPSIVSSYRIRNIFTKTSTPHSSIASKIFPAIGRTIGMSWFLSKTQLSTSTKTATPPNKNTDEERQNELWFAIARNDTEKAKTLILNGRINLAYNDEDTRSFLGLATKKGNNEIAQLLIKKGVDVNEGPKNDNWVYPPIFDAVCNCDQDTIQAFLNNGAILTRKDSLGVFHPILDHPRDNCSITEENRPRVEKNIKVLLMNGADIHGRNFCGNKSRIGFWNRLRYTILPTKKYVPKKTTPYVIPLIDKDFEPYDYKLYKSTTLQDCLLEAIQLGHNKDAIKMINSGSIDVNNHHDYLRSAIMWDRNEVVIALIEKGAKLRETNSRGWNANSQLTGFF